eukprot:TRINITY_DN414_c0_g1_i5.p1 TRINITY_DN414_c0_g1~~TRINITY_DN414_c0_g1_i5.p1  ORF type:complete len:182 (-),score=4.69 TRINITY_DN414_c0_g1_i5:353-898(-)
METIRMRTCCLFLLIVSLPSVFGVRFISTTQVLPGQTYTFKGNLPAGSEKFGCTKTINSLNDVYTIYSNQGAICNIDTCSGASFESYIEIFKVKNGQYKKCIPNENVVCLNSADGSGVMLFPLTVTPGLAFGISVAARAAGIGGSYTLTLNCKACPSCIPVTGTSVNGHHPPGVGMHKSLK